MEIAEILSPERTRCCLPEGSKKRVLEFFAHSLATQYPDVSQDTLYEKLLARERLGSTGIGDGVAIPHCRLPGFNLTVGMLVKLENPIDFDAIDSQPVDLVFALVVPEEHNDEHLQTLSSIARLLQNPEQRDRLRRTTTDQALYEAAIVKRVA